MSNDERLSRIETLWSVVRRANAPDGPHAADAQRQLLDRYGGAVRRYLGACLRDRDAADEVFQEFALRFVRGDFKNADPSRGRFRSFVKTVIYRLVIDFRRRQGRAKREQAHPEEPHARPEPAGVCENSDELFLSSWRDELLARAWQGLEAHERQTGAAWHTALRLRVDEPDLRSPDLAARLTVLLGKPMTPEAVRVLIHRARDRFADLLLDAVADSLDAADAAAIEEELVDLRLLDYCRDALDKRR